MKGVARAIVIGLAGVAFGVAGCGGGESDGSSPENHEGVHSPDDGHDHAAHDDGHGHGEEVSLGSVSIGGMDVECAQGHGTVAPGRMMHLVVKLPYTDDGATTVRAWIGIDDRLGSRVGKGEYAPSHDDYDIHAEAPSPLPEGAAWWIEIEKPDGSTHVGSIACR